MTSGMEMLLGDTGWLAWTVIVLAVVGGSIMQVGVGVGFGSVAAPAAMLVAPSLMPATISCLAFSSASLGSSRIAGRIAFRELAFSILGRIIGASIAGWLLVTVGSREGFALVFAALTLLGVGLSLVKMKLPLNGGTLVLAGGLSGLMATVTTIGGPPMALVYQNQAAEKARPTLNAFFAIGMIPSLVALWAAGMLGTVDVLRTVLLLPAVVAGIFAARSLAPFIDRRYRSILLGFCMLAALTIGARALARVLV